MTTSINIQSYLDNLTFLALFVGMLSYWTSISFTSLKVGAKIGFISICVANCAIFINLGSRWLENGYFPLSNLYESLLFFIWGITAITIFIEKRIAISLIGAVTSPLSLFVVAFATLSLPEGMQKAAPLVPALKSNWLMMHVSIMMLSYSTLITGSLLSILFLVLTLGKNISLQGNSIGTTESEKVNTRNMSMAVLEGSLPNKSVNGSEGLGLLETLDNLSYRIIGLGFPLLTIGIIAGAVWANEAWGAYWSWDPKETWALITWFVFAAYLHARITKSWQGKRPAILASIGFVVVWICYLGVNFLGKGLHSYGWIA
jgi:cytochrome c-type biogenesis protein CcsB|tara:strand:+ start:88 stop:1035 length:948 start_codon:yes stop_codon:yes gene_type:complete